MVEVDSLPKLRRIRLVHDPRQWNFDEVGISEEFCAIGISTPHRLDEAVERVRIALTELFKIVPFKNI